MSAFGNAGRVLYEDVKPGRSPQIEHINKARQAAEALFAPKQAIGPTPECVPPDSTGTRKPRILSAQAAHGTPSEQTKVPVELKPLRPCYQVPASDLTRIRTWLKYGMTIRQVAKMFHVDAGEMKGILKRVEAPATYTK